MKTVTNTLGHKAQMAAVPIYGKNSSSPKPIDCLEIWYVALGTGVHQRLFK